MRSPRTPVWRDALRLVSAHRRWFAVSFVSWMAYHLLPAFVGLATRAVFDRLVADGRLSQGVAAAVGVFVAVEIVRSADFYVSAVSWTRCWVAMESTARSSVLQSLVGGPRPRTLPGGSAEAANRLRDDVTSLVEFIDTWLDVAGTGLFMLVAVWQMSSIDGRLTAIVLVPQLVVMFASHRQTARLARNRRAARKATAAAVSFLGDAFAGVSAVKVAGAEEGVVDRVRALGEGRRTAAVRDRLSLALLQSLHMTAVHVGLAAILIVSAREIRTGGFTVGDLTLFVAYTERLGGFPHYLGRMLGRQVQAGVALDRLVRVTDAPRGEAFAGFDDARTPAVPVRSSLPPLEALELRGVRAGRNVRDVDLVVPRGALVAVTGPVGSGKTTLVRAVLGLIPLESGEIRWNGAVVDDPASALIPPRCAYTPQQPRLFSESLRDNIALGHAGGDDAVRAAMHLAVLDDDADHLDLDTLIGSRGIRLSGGQAQRTAAARMLVRAPDLLVFDDLSSALDVETEAHLWDRVLGSTAAGGVTCLVVTSRPAVLARATHVLTLNA